MKALAKTMLAKASHALRVPAVLGRVNETLRGPVLRGVNYHETVPKHADGLRRHLDHFLERYEILDEAGLDAFFEGTLSREKPALLVQFDDGQRNNHEVAARVLEEFDVRGWFFIVSGFAGTTKAWSPDNVCDYMGWDDVVDLDRRGHVIGCHSRSHVKLAGLESATLMAEVVESKHDIEARLGHPVRTFCLPFGTGDSYDIEALAALKRNYDYVFNANAAFHGRSATKWNLGRIPLEPDMSLEMVDFLSAGAIDLRFAGRWGRTEWLLRHAKSRSAH